VLICSAHVSVSGYITNRATVIVSYRRVPTWWRSKKACDARRHCGDSGATVELDAGPQLLTACASMPLSCRRHSSTPSKRLLILDTSDR
jgi:hypothetical protein